MKKTFLLFGLFAGFGAAGQNNDLLDIQKLIKEKQAKNKDVFQNHMFKVPPSSPLIQLSNPDIYILPNGDKVVYGYGRMPTVQPDMRNFTLLMPRVDPYYQLPNTMPNGSRFNDLGVAGPNSIMDQLAPSPILEKLLKNSNK